MGILLHTHQVFFWFFLYGRWKHTHHCQWCVCFTYIFYFRVRAHGLLRDDKHSEEAVVVESCVDTNIMNVCNGKLCKQMLQLLITTPGFQPHVLNRPWVMLVNIMQCSLSAMAKEEFWIVLLYFVLNFHRKVVQFWFHILNVHTCVFTNPVSHPAGSLKASSRPPMNPSAGKSEYWKWRDGCLETINLLYLCNVAKK